MTALFWRRARLLAPALAAGLLFPALPAVAADVHQHGGLRGDLTPDQVAIPKGGEEVPSLGTERSRTWAKPDGSLVTRVWNRPVNVKTAAGWKAIDNTLKASQAGGFVKGEGGYDLRVPSSLAEPVRLRDGDRWIELRLQGSDAAAKVTGSSATYANAGKGADLKLTAFDDAIKEDLVLAGVDSQNSFTYEVGLSAGLKLELRKDGGADVVDGKGEVAFAIPAPIAEDAKGAIAAGGDASMTFEDGKLTVTLSKQWLAAEDRAFPVTLDPSAAPGATRDTFVDEITPSTGYSSSDTLYVGREAAGHDHTALTHFNVAGTVPAAAFVQRATLNLWPTAETASSPAKTLQAHRITSDWDSSATWLKKNATTNWATPGGEYNPGAVSEQPAGIGQWTRFTATNLVSAWLDGSNANQGIAISDGNSTADRAVIFASSEASNSTLRPYLEIEYFPRAGVQPNSTFDEQSITDRSSLGVNVANGNLLLSSTDLKVAGTGLPLEVQRFYNSSDTTWKGMFGPGGRISLGNDLVLYECDGVGSRCLVGPSGFRARFTRNSGGLTYATPPGIGNVSLTRTGASSGEFTLTDNSSGTKYKFFDAPFSFNNQIIDRHNNAISFAAAGPNGSLSKITDTQGREFPVQANAAGYITKIQVPSTITGGGFEWQYGYDTSNRLTSVTDPEGGITEYRWTAGSPGRIDRIKDPRGNYIHFVYDTSFRVTSVRREIDNGAADVTTTYAYASPDSVCEKSPGVMANGVIGKTTVTDPEGKATKYCWNKDGAVVRAVDADGDETSTTIDPGSGNVTQFAQYAGTSSPLSTSSIKYDAAGSTTGRPESIRGAAKEKTAISYAGQTTAQDQSGFGRTQAKKVTSPHGNITRYKYDDSTSTSSFNVTEISDEADPTTSDPNPQPGLKSTFTYKTNKALLATVTQDGKTTSYDYDVKGNLIKVTPASAAIGNTEYTYDGLSRVTSMKDGRTGQWVNYTYDDLGRQLSSPDSDGQYTTVTYDANGNVATRTAPGQSSSYTYDKLNRKTSENLHGTSTSYGYDKNGNLTSLIDASGAVTYGYDNIGRVASVVSFPASGSTADTTNYAYQDPDKNTNPTSSWVTQTLKSGAAGTIKTTRDLSGKITEILVKNGTTQTLKRTYEYGSVTWDNDPAEGEFTDQLGKVTEQNGDTTAPTTVKEFTYTGSGQIKEINTTTGASSTLEAFTYDGAGNRTKKVTTPSSGSPSTVSYAYNQVNQLCWKHNAASTAACSAPPTGATTYSYDLAGNQTGGGFTASYDAKGRLDGYNGIYSKILSPTNNEIIMLGTGNTFTNTSMGVQRIEMASNLSKLIRTPEDGSVVAQVRDGAKNWLVQDHLGSTIALTDANGAIKRTYNYDVDGNATTAAVGAAPNPETWIKYAGGHDIGGGLYHYGARFYQPSTARWTQQDPLEQPGDLRQHNRYGYVGGDPINYTDPDGRRAAAAGLLCATSAAAGGAIRKAWDGEWNYSKTNLVRDCVGGVLAGGLATGYQSAKPLVKRGWSKLKDWVNDGYY